jgi:hypothetical protein
MSGAQVSLFRSAVKGCADDLDKISILTGFVSEQLFLIHEEKESAMTVFQLAAMLELMDNDLIAQSELLRSALS